MNFYSKHRYKIYILAVAFALALFFFIFQNSRNLPDNNTKALILSAGEADWIKRNPTVFVGIDPDFMPIEYLDQNNEYVGVTADFLSIAQEKTGLVFVIDKKHTWEDSFRRIKRGDVHMVGAAVSSDKRQKLMLFTTPYVALSGVIIVRKSVLEPMSMEKLKGMTVTVVKQYIWEDLLQTSYPELTLSPAPNIKTALKKVSFGISDAMVGYMATASHHIERLGISNLKISGDNVDILDISFAVSKKHPELHSILNRVLAAIPKAQKKQIIKKWISLELNPLMDLKFFTRFLFSVIAVIVLILGGIIIWNQSLQRKVAKRTQTLNVELAQRKRVETALRESEEKYRGIFENIQDVYYEITREGRIIEISPSVTKVLGHQRNQMLDNTMPGIFSDPKDFTKMVNKVIRKHRLTDYETLLKQPGGELLNCSMNAMLIQPSGKKPFKIIGSIRNITSRVKSSKALKKAYRELEQRVLERTAELRNTNRQLNKAKEAADAATQAKSNFLANMSHEIRTPLNGVISATELIMNASPPRKISKYLNMIQTSGQALMGVINDILDFSKIEAGKLDLEIRPFRMDTLINGISDIFKEQIETKQLDYVVQRDPDIPVYLSGDSFRLQQILTNLLSNAVKFTPRKGKISLAVSKTGCSGNPGIVQMAFDVCDTGIGISTRHQELLFTPFSQIDASTTRKYGGSGLGLSICGQLIDMMDGTITVKSRPQEGSLFSFTIPLGIPQEDDVTDTFVPPLSGHPENLWTYKSILEGRSVLVVEDNLTNQEIILEVLDVLNIKTTLAANGIQAVHAVKNKDFHAVLMDIQMPEMDGLEATREIRKFKGKQQLPIIAMTAHTLKQDKAKCLSGGMNAYISKPVSQETLFKTLISLIVPHPPEHLPDTGSRKLKRAAETSVDGTRLKTGYPENMDGLAIKRALDTLGIFPDQLFKIYNTFVKNYKDIIPQINRAWDDMDKDMVISLIHSLKGSAAGIGADSVHARAKQIEMKLKTKQHLPLKTSLKLNQLEYDLDTVFSSIHGLISMQASQESAGIAVKNNPSMAIETLHELETSLELGEMASLEAIMAKLESVCRHPLMIDLINQIAYYDHDLAKQTIDQLLREMEDE